MIRVTCKVKVYFLGRTLFLILSLSIFTRMIIINTSTAGRTRTVILFPPWGLREVSAHTVICYTSNFIYYTGVVVVVFYPVKKMGPTVAHTPNTRKNFPFQPGNHWGHTSISGLSLFFLSFDFRALNFSFFQKIIPSCVCVRLLAWKNHAFAVVIFVCWNGSRCIAKVLPSSITTPHPTCIVVVVVSPLTSLNNLTTANESLGSSIRISVYACAHVSRFIMMNFFFFSFSFMCVCVWLSLSTVSMTFQSFTGKKIPFFV